jgi:hypothetical protein
VEVGYVEIIPGTGYIMGMDIWATIDEQLHAHSPELGQTLVPLVQDITPVRTGALQSSVTYEAYPDPQGYGAGQSDLVFVYAEDAEQLAAWKRVYVQYQEGPPLGLRTYTNPPRQMFLQTAQGMGYTETADWAVHYVQTALDMCAGGAGVPWGHSP